MNGNTYNRPYTNAEQDLCHSHSPLHDFLPVVSWFWGLQNKKIIENEWTDSNAE